MKVTKEFRAVALKGGLYLDTLAATPHQANNQRIMKRFEVTEAHADSPANHDGLWHKCHAEGDRNVRVTISWEYPE